MSERLLRRLSHRLEYAGYRLLTAVANALPERTADRTGAWIGRLVERIGIRRQVALENLRAAFPEQDAAWIRRVLRASYEHLGREAISILRLPRIPPDRWLERIRYPEEEMAAVRRALERGRGAVIVTGHIGGLEAAARTLTALGFTLHAYFQRMANPYVDAEVARTRAAIGIQLIDRGRGVGPGVQALLQNHLVAVVADQDARSHGVFVPFMGRPASTFRGPAIMALRANAPIFFGFAKRDGDGWLGGVREVLVPRDGDPDDVSQRMVAEYTARLEAVVREAPEQYFWQHRRWKTMPPAAAPEPAPGATV